MNCIKCKVEIAEASAVAGKWCWRCGEKQEERAGKAVDEKLTSGEMARAKASLEPLRPPPSERETPPPVVLGKPDASAEPHHEQPAKKGHR